MNESTPRLQASQANKAVPQRRRSARAVAVAATALTLGVGAAVATAPAADASATYCGGGRCTLYLSKSETRDLGNARIPAPPAGVPAQIRVAYYAAAAGHIWFAGQYAKQGKCSAFTLSIYPWETQGYYGYSCNWN